MTELEPGQQLLARFRLDRLLGRGGMGQVWLATDEALGEPVALKILDDQLVGQPGMLDLLRHECRQARRLVHPGAGESTSLLAYQVSMPSRVDEGSAAPVGIIQS